MKSLFKISSRYVVTAALITLLVLTTNIAGILIYLSHISKGLEDSGMGRSEMTNIEKEMSKTAAGYEMSEAGYALLQNSACLWAMRLNNNGDVVWEYQLPDEISRHYSLSDVAVFSRWYLNDYPIFTWKNGDDLMVYGVNKHVARFDFYGDIRFYRKLPQMFYLLLLFNLFLIAGLALLFGFRFYRSLRPVAKGIEQLSSQEEIHLPEKGMVSDLTRQLNQTSAILQSQNEQLQKRDQARTDWIAGVSHDVRTPLSFIMGFSDELATSPELEEELQKKAELIRNQSQIIKNLIADLNLTVKLEYQSQPLQKENLSPAKMLREMIAELYNQSIDAHYQIIPIIEKDAQKAMVFGDRQLLSRVFQNMIGNSIRHNPDGCEIKITMSVNSGNLLLLFSDSGNGIPGSVVEILEGKKAEQPEIHIMGLRIVLQIIKAHGGEVAFLKGHENGNHIMIYLPINNE